MDIDGSEILDLVRYLDGAEHRAAEQTYPVVEQHAIELRNAWRDNARATAGKHGKHYPRAITAEQIPRADAVEWEIGPETRKPQGGMGAGFEYGSRNQPPHWDGTRAAVAQEPKFLAALDDIVRGLL